MCNKEYLNLQTGEVLDLNKVRELKDNAMLKVKPELWIEWDFEKNDELGLDIWYMTKASQKKVWWICSECKNNIDIVVNTRVNTYSKCAYCAGKKATKENSLATLYPEITKEWSHTKNKNLKPENTLPRSHKKVWWIGECGHEWETSVSNRTRGSGCPYCAGQKVNHTNSLSTKNSELCREWHHTKNGELTPDDVTCGSSRKVWWQCEEGHEWNARINSRSLQRLGCPYCTNQKTMIGFNDIHTTNPKMGLSLVNYEDGFKYTQGSNIRVEFKCPDCNDYIGERAIIDIFTYGISCSKCSDGRSYPEKFMANLLSEVNVKFKMDTAFEWSQGKRYDFYIPSLNTIIEVHGMQHYNGGFKSLGGKDKNEEFENDLFKKQLALNNRIYNYVEIDASYSTFEWMKDNIQNSILTSLIDFSNVDWETVSLKSIKSLIVTICEEYDKTDILTKELSLKYNLSVSTVYKYLRKGFSSGITKYTHDKQKIPNICNMKQQRKVVRLDNDDSCMGIYESIKAGLNDIGITHTSAISGVSSCCKGRIKSAYGYKWMYLEDYQKLNNKTS